MGFAFHKRTRTIDTINDFLKKNEYKRYYNSREITRFRLVIIYISISCGASKIWEYAGKL
jgi:hypothetical protein